MVLYVTLILYILHYLGVLHVNHLKDVVFWFVIVAIPLFFTANKVREDKNYFKTKFVEYVKLITIFGFIINIYTLNIFIEIVLQIVLLFLILLIVFLN